MGSQSDGKPLDHKRSRAVRSGPVVMVIFAVIIAVVVLVAILQGYDVALWIRDIIGLAFSRGG